MKRISPVLFLTLVATMVLNDQTSFAQSQSLDMAPGPVAEVLPEFDTPSNGGFDYLDSAPAPNRLPAPEHQTQPTESSSVQLPETNALPPATSQASSLIASPARNSLPLFDTPAQPRSTVSPINSAPPTMPSAAMAIPPTPGSFYPGSTPVNSGEFGVGQKAAHSGLPAAASTASAPTLAAQPCDSQSTSIVSEGDCSCDPCAEGEFVSTGDCDTCKSSEEACYVDGDECENYDDCDLAECSESEEELYDNTGADRIDGTSSRRSNRSRGHKGIFGRHRAKHLAKKERRAQRKQDDERQSEEDQYVVYQDEEAYYQDEACDIGDNYVAAPAVVPVNREQANGSGVNTMIGVSGLYFNRNYGDDQQVSASQFPNERGLFANDADHGDFYGYDLNLTRRKANGNGFEARYFSLEPSRATATLGGAPLTTLNAASVNDPAIYLSGVGVPNFGTGGVVADVTAAELFNYADVHQVTRESSIKNVEFNLLRLGRTGQRKKGAGRTASHEYLLGFRYFQFDESFGYNAQAFRQNTVASHLLQAEYLNEVTNRLFGAQIGGRTEIGFLRKFSLIIGTKAGIFNNRFTNNQSVMIQPRGADAYAAQVLNGVYSGQAFDTEGDNSDITMLGELDLGLTYRMFSNSRLRVGYRALFVSDVAFAVPQTELYFSDLNAVQSPTANDDLVLHGGYFGAEFAF